MHDESSRPSSQQPALELGAAAPGVSVVVTTYRRDATLKVLLKSLRCQRTSFPLQVFLINNWPRKVYRQSVLSAIGRSLRSFGDATVINCSRNTGCAFRYSVATFAKYDTILFLDDDLELMSPTFIRDMRDYLVELAPYDIVSCWCARFKGLPADYYDTTSYSFLDPYDLPQEVDLVGPGVSMFRKRLLLSGALDIADEFRNADNVWLSIVPSLLLGSRKYYFPSRGMVRFVEDGKFAMFKDATVRTLKGTATTRLVARGYVPVSMRQDRAD